MSNKMTGVRVVIVEYHQGKLNYRLRLTYASVKSLKSGTR
jgi:hypothetical protein